LQDGLVVEYLPYNAEECPADSERIRNEGRVPRAEKE